jgi:sortase (surface protein transpeptidase)
MDTPVTADAPLRSGPGRQASAWPGPTPAARRPGSPGRRRPGRRPPQGGAAWLGLLLLALLAAACAPAAAAPATTNAPAATWTMPFAAPSATPAPAGTQAPEATATPRTHAGAARPAPHGDLPEHDAARITPTATEPPPTPTPPPRLIIEAMQLDKEIVPVPIVDGDWDLSHLDEQVGWLATTGRAPGEELAMALVAHLTLESRVPGPFSGVGQLTPDDPIVYVLNGVEYSYRVLTMRKRPASDVLSLYVPDGNRLLLVTCIDYNFLRGTYSNRLIVTAQLVSQRPVE